MGNRIKLGFCHFRNAWFLLALSLFLIHLILERGLNWKIPFWDNYGDPIVFMPIFLHFILWEDRFVRKKGTQYILSWKKSLFWWVIISIIVEYFFPKWTDGFTADYLDVLLYGLGTLFFMVFMNRPLDCAEK